MGHSSDKCGTASEWHRDSTLRCFDRLRNRKFGDLPIPKFVEPVETNPAVTSAFLVQVAAKSQTETDRLLDGSFPAWLGDEQPLQEWLCRSVWATPAARYCLDNFAMTVR